LPQNRRGRQSAEQAPGQSESVPQGGASPATSNGPAEATRAEHHPGGGGKPQPQWSEITPPQERPVPEQKATPPGPLPPPPRSAGRSGSGSLGTIPAEVGARIKSPASPPRGAVIIDASWLSTRGRGPYVLDRHDATYCLASDVRVEGTAFVVGAKNV